MRGLGLERPPRWGIAVLVLAVIGNLALFGFLALRPAPSDPYVSSTGAPGVGAPTQTEDASSSAAVSPKSADPLLLAVYGDGYAAGNESGGLGAAGWPAIVAERAGMRLALNAVSRAGYASVGATAQTLRDVVLASPVADAAVTVLFGSRNDAGEDLARVQVNAAEAIAAARSAAPQATVVVIGPAWSDAAVPAAVLGARDAVRAAAVEADVTFIDPIKAGWFADPEGLIAADGVSPTDAGHAYLAGLIAPAVRTATEAVGRP
jgi:hypothetical protein